MATEWVENGKGRQAAYDGQEETFKELEDDGSLFGECSKKTTAECDVVFTNPPFKKYSAMLKDVIGKKDFVLLAPHILPYRINDVENQLIYRIAKGEVFIEPGEIAIWNEDHTRQAACVVVSTIKPEGVQKVDIELSAKYDQAKHKMFIDAETGEPTGVVNCDRFKDFPVDWPGLVAIPVTTLMKIANQKTRVIDARGMDGYSKYANNVSAIKLVDNLVIHGQYGRNGGENSFLSGANCMELVDSLDIRGTYNMGTGFMNAMELTDGVAIHGFYGKGDTEKPYMEFSGHKIIKVKLEDGRVPFQRIIVKLNRKAKT